MQIDPTMSWKTLSAPQSNTKSAESGTEFYHVLNNLVSEDSSPTASRSLGGLAPGVTWEDGLLWQHLGQGQQSLSVLDQQQPTEASVSTVPLSIEELIRTAGEQYGVPISLIKAVIDTESSFNSNAVSSAGAKGLMQLMDGTARGLGVSNSFDPAQNIDGGTKYLSSLMQRFGGEMAMVLAAYNAGPTRVAQLGVSNDQELMSVLDGLPSETQAYIGKVLNAEMKYNN
ncbi:hypothetical protein JCM10914A_35700 [Paenibacillus sp. JCM 10914]|uniref:lytic transglycosylase domain-containing protein n=1 Tax=Paenibacillus sp. JCM 10914 TaxID=1236974 RepID=UPI0003CC497D|nr:lytic transglycosylase domain-containing protein [Paenibacillus sp. JCM 10914]GAE04217.1 membrane-bound lytic murein transglycosylase D precursor [Paenibacillus sp. JCM 10914]